ncbi:sulfite exporter TauE/SafE family protein [Blastochloris viridis]|uniref:Probable membrane transporter protein n=1 Tax=Blastochloris viridis TaxID=1079 RepID=A0A0H5BFX1_BLAVI|nr:sulfite exporter TauE/SafE family protein [Blastochloris viridis]ALK10080.1 Sulfite exporter TauE/SafE [Blastochloris viridis]BAR99994.1 hypothetical protein BV133_2401 [Blastochloris viridis]CUU42744.1 Sulfite exporter TauE/SafE [Blastochloris viridis]
MIDIPLGELAVLAAALIAAGVITGLMAGLFGVGGGAVIVPVLYQVFQVLGVPEEVRMHLAVGSSLAIIIPTSIQSFRAHLKKGAVRLDVLKVWALPVVAGVVVGGVVAAYAPAVVLKLVFVAVATTIVIKTFSGRDDWRIADDLPGPAALRGYGFGIGIASTLMGVGGGAMANMVFALYNKPIHTAVATSSGLGVLISLPGALGYIIAGWPHMAALPPFSLGFVSLIGVILIAPTATLAAPYGARLAHRLPRRRLEIAFGVFLTLVSLRFLADILF